MNHDFRDRFETLLTVGVGLAVVALSYVVVAGAIGIFLGLVRRAYLWVA